MNKFAEFAGKKIGLKCFCLTLLILLLVTFPLVATPYLQHLAIMVFLYAFLGQAWNILGGYAGQFSFGHAVFFGLGAYVPAILYTKLGVCPWVGMLAGGVVSLFLGFSCGYLSFRYGLKGAYFALVMLGFAEVLRIIALNWDFVNGAVGILLPIKGNSFYYFQFVGRREYYYIIFAMTVFSIYITHRIEHSKIGDYFLSIRENEEASEAIGINVFKYKMVAIGISAFLTSLGGTFFAQYTSYIEPNIYFGVTVSIEILIRPILGGIGMVWGPIFGASILGPIGEISRVLLGGYSGIHLALYGLIIMIVIVYLPSGVVGLFKKHKFLERKFS